MSAYYNSICINNDITNIMIVGILKSLTDIIRQHKNEKPKKLTIIGKNKEEPYSCNKIIDEFSKLGIKCFDNGSHYYKLYKGDTYIDTVAIIQKAHDYYVIKYGSEYQLNYYANQL